MELMYGYDVKSFEDPCVAAADGSIKSGSAFVVAGTTWISILPSLTKLPMPSWFPGATSWRMADMIRKLSKDAKTLPFDFAKANLVSVNMNIPCQDDP